MKYIHNILLKLLTRHFVIMSVLLVAITITQPLFAQYTLQDADVIMTNGVIDSCLYNFEETDIIIPEILQGQTVIEIADGVSFTKGVFGYKGITSIKLPKTIEYIGYYAFRDNALTSLDLSNCVNLKQISIEGFSRNQLTSINFSGCDNLFFIGNYAFGGNLLTNVDLTGCDNLSIINLYAFRENSLSAVNITQCKSLTYIDYAAFYLNPGLEGFILPNSEKPGYKLVKWLSGNDNAEYVGGDYTTNLTSCYTAEFTLATYTIFYNMDGGTHSNILEYTMDQTPVVLNPAQKENYSFVGWYDNPEFTGNPITELTEGTYGDLELWAKWEAILGVNTLADILQVNVYPNPASHTLNINSNSLDVESISIIDVSGHIVYVNSSINSKDLQISIEHFTEGLYYVLVRQNNGRLSTQKIIKTN